MYCKRCKTLIDDNTLICPKCKYDNLLDKTSSFEFKNINDIEKKKIKKKQITIILLIFVLLISVILIYIIKDNKSIINNIDQTQEIQFINNFIFENLVFNYPDTFGTSKNTIFYKNNNEYYININIIDELEYNDIINSNDVSESKLGNFDTITYANDSSYTHILNYNNIYYEITVNYLANENLENTKTQLEMSKIINSIQEK